MKKSLDDSVAKAGAAQEELNQNQIQVSFNKFEQAGFTATGKLLFFSPNLEEEYSRLKLKHGFGEVPDIQTKGLVALSFPVKDIATDDAVQKIKELVDGLGLPEVIRSQISIINDLDKVAFGFVPSKAFLKDIENVAPILDQVRQQAKVNQEVDITLRLASSPKLILEGEEPILNEILKGLQVHMRVNAWKRLSGIITSMLSEGALPENLMPILGGVSPAFMLKVNGKLEIDIDDEMKEGLMTNPLLEPFMMPGSILVNSASKVHSDEEEEFKEHFEQSVPPPIQPIATFMMQHIGDELNVFVGQDLLGLQGRVTAEGMGSLVKTVLKFIG